MSMSLAKELKAIQKEKYRASVEAVVNAHKQQQGEAPLPLRKDTGKQRDTVSQQAFSFSFGLDDAGVGVGVGDVGVGVGGLSASQKKRLRKKNNKQGTQAENETGAEASTATAAEPAAEAPRSAPSSSPSPSTAPVAPNKTAKCANTTPTAVVPTATPATDATNKQQGKKAKAKAKAKGGKGKDGKSAATAAEEDDDDMAFLTELAAQMKTTPAPVPTSVAAGKKGASPSKAQPNMAPGSGRPKGGPVFQSAKDSNLTPQMRAKVKYGDGRNIVALSRQAKVRDQNWLLGSALTADAATAAGTGGEPYGLMGAAATSTSSGNEGSETPYITHSSPFSFGFQLH
jgi:hypothetical protein